MPYYYDLTREGVTTSGTANTEVDDMRTLSVANQAPAVVTGLYGSGRNSGTTAGGVQLRLRRFSTPSTVGTAKTPAERNPNGPAAQLTAFTGPTAGSTATDVLSIGFGALGGMGGWVALESDAGHFLRPNGGADGNLDVFHIAAIASVAIDYTLEFKE